MTTRRWMIVVAGVAFAVALWQADPLARRWQSVCSVSFSPDGRTLAAGSYRGKSFSEDVHWCIGDIGQTVALFGADTGSSQGVLENVRYQGSSWGLPSTPLGQFLSFSPDGRTLAAGTWDGTVKLWDCATRQPKDILRTGCLRVTNVAFSRDGRTLALASPDSLTLWDTASDGAGKQVDPPGIGVRSFAFSPDSELIAVGSRYSVRGAALWDVNRAYRKSSVPITEGDVLALAFGSNGRYLALGGRKTAVLWDVGEGKSRFEVKGPWTVAVALSPDCEILATAGADGLRFWKTATGEPVSAFRPVPGVGSLAYSPDGRLLAAGDTSGYVTVWDTSTGRRRWSARVSGPPRIDLISVLAVIACLGLVLKAVLNRRWRSRSAHRGDGASDR
jgi:WD40 repeat protein